MEIRDYAELCTLPRDRQLARQTRGITLMSDGKMIQNLPQDWRKQQGENTSLSIYSSSQKSQNLFTCESKKYISNMENMYKLLIIMY